MSDYVTAQAFREAAFALPFDIPEACRLLLAAAEQREQLEERDEVLNSIRRYIDDPTAEPRDTTEVRQEVRARMLGIVLSPADTRVNLELREQLATLTAEHNKWVLGAAAMSHEHGELEAQIATLTAENKDLLERQEAHRFELCRLIQAAQDGWRATREELATVYLVLEAITAERNELEGRIANALL